MKYLLKLNRTSDSLERKSLKISAHRGASGDYPENTLPAYRAALDEGCSSLECDVRQTSDGVLVLSHDADLKRTAGKDALIHSLSYEEVSAIDVGSWFSKEFKDTHIPRLEELLEELTASVELHIDVKQGVPPYPRFEDRILGVAGRHARWIEKMTFASSDGSTLKRLRALNGELRLGYQPRTQSIEEAFAAAEDLKVESMRLRMERLTSEWVQRAHDAGMEVYVYTVNTPEEFERMNEMGVDLVFSNFPASCKRLHENARG